MWPALHLLEPSGISPHRGRLVGEVRHGLRIPLVEEKPHQQHGLGSDPKGQHYSAELGLWAGLQGATDSLREMGVL